MARSRVDADRRGRSAEAIQPVNASSGADERARAFERPMMMLMQASDRYRSDAHRSHHGAVMFRLNGPTSPP
jgi:hypothetical protein